MTWTAPQTWTGGESPTAAKLNANVRDNAKEIWREIAYEEFTATVTTTTHTQAAPLDVVSTGLITLTAHPILVEFFCSGWNPGGGAGSISLWDGATDLGKLIVTGSAAASEPVLCTRRLTPTDAGHTYTARIWTTGGAAAVAGASGGGLGNSVPGYLAIYQRGG